VANAHQWAGHVCRRDGELRTVQIPAGLKALLDQGLRPGRLNLECLLTRVNWASVPDVAALSRDLGLGLHLETPVPKARALANYEQLALSAEEYRRLHDRLAGILGEEYFQAHRAQRCPVERNPVVWTNGDVAFCSSRSAPVGNVRDTPLSTLYAKARRLKRREDRRIARQGRQSRYFFTCPSRRYHQAMHGLPCDY
jgi:MoaA/NifB/PqqE/SkfB family radical SAM enzyme